jgi:hypothetical protein
VANECEILNNIFWIWLSMKIVKEMNAIIDGHQDRCFYTTTNKKNINYIKKNSFLI